MKKEHIKLLLKLTLIISAFVLVFSKIDTDELYQYLTKLPLISIISAYILLVMAQIVSSLRTRYYFHNNGLNFNKKFSVGLYFVGMLFNNILPGGIGGDGYKIYLLGKLANFSHITSLKTLISDRASGLFILMLLTFLLMPLSSLSNILPNLNILIILGIFITIAGYFISIKILLNESVKTAIRAVPYSLIVQTLALIIVVLIISGMDVDMNNTSMVTGYIILFYAASIVSILPISIGGIGIRELVFVYCCPLIGLDSELGVALSLVFFAITMAASLNGIIFLQKLESIYNEGESLGSTTNT